MEKHTKVYLETIPSHTGHYPCEVCGKKGSDIHHIHRRSEFGNKTKEDQDKIENIICLCRPCHDKAHANHITKTELITIHQRYLKLNSVDK